MDDDEGFEALVAARLAALVATAYLVTADRGVAEDCVQEALVRVYRRWRRIEPGGRVAYLNRAVINTALSWRRRRRIAEVPLDMERHALALEPTDPSGFDPRLMSALWSLAPRARATVVLRYVEGMSEAETAAALGCSVGSVKSAGSRGLARLREVLGDADDDEGTAAVKARGGRTA